MRREAQTKKLRLRSFAFCLFGFGFICGLGSASAQGQVTDQRLRGLRIGSIETAGNVRISRSAMLAKVRSRVGELFDPVTAAEDAARIGKLAGVEYSYYSTAVVDNKVQLTFVVVEKNIVRSIAFVGNRAIRTGPLRKKLDLKIGDYLDTILAEAGRRALTEFYQEKGFAFVQVKLNTEQLAYGKVIYTIDEGPRVAIKSVRFSGNKAIRTAKLRRAVKTREKKWFVLASYYVEEKVAKDVTKLQNIYQKKGFLDSSITVEKEFNKDKSKVRITFIIDEGPVYTVERIVFTGVRHFEQEKVRSEMRLTEGQIYSEQRAGFDARRLLALYREVGFIDAAVEWRRTFVSGNRVNVEFDVTEGERFRIGRINITGNVETQDKVVRRVLDEHDFQPGQWYNADAARGDGSGELEKRIRRMVLMETATITPSGEMAGQRDAQVSVIEGQTGMVMLGAGVASDSGLIGQLVFEQRNFDISDWPESFGELVTGKAFKGAGQSLRIALQPGTIVSEYLVSFTEPYFQDKPIALDVVGSNWERDRESYDEERMRAHVGFTKRFKNRWRHRIGFRVENIDVTGLDSDAPQDIRDVKGDNGLAGIKIGAGRDLTDDRFNPSKGHSFDVSYEQVAGDHTFGVLSGIYRQYRTLYEDLAEQRTILGTKLLAATVIGDAPPFEKFYGGGTGTYGIRGFDYRGISTRGLQTGVPNPRRKDPIGSDWIFLANAEVTVPLVSENFAALFFVDSGAIDSGNYRVAGGAGIQILIPQWFGPVPMRFELATPLMKDDSDETQVFSFSVGRLF